MKIGYDLDWTLTTWKTPPWNFASQLIDRRDWIGEPPSEYGLHVFSPQTREVLIQLFNSDFYMNQCPVPRFYSQNLLTQQHVAGNRQFIITARAAHIRPGTISLVNRFFPEVEDVLFVDPGHSKASTIDGLGLDVWVDDDPNELARAGAAGLPTIIAEAPWNETNWPHARRASDCLQIAMYLDKLKEDLLYYGKIQS